MIDKIGNFLKLNHFSFEYQGDRINFFDEQTAVFLSAHYDELIRLIRQQLTLEASQQKKCAIKINNIVYELVITPIRPHNERFQIDACLATEQEESILIKTLVSESSDTFIIFNENARIKYCNKAVQEYLNKSIQEIYKSGREEYDFPDELIELWEESVLDCIRTGSEVRIEFQMPDEQWYDWLLLYRHVNGENLVFAYSRNITDQKLLTSQNQITKSNLMDALRIAKVAMWELNPHNRQFVLNEQFFLLFGEERYGQYISISFYDFIETHIYHEDKKAVESLFVQFMEDQDFDNDYLFEFRVNHKSEAVKSMLMSVHLRKSKQNELDLIYGTIQDITNLKEAEKELEQYRNRLETLVKKRTDELKKSEDRLTDALNLAKLGTWDYDFRTDTFSIEGAIPTILGLDREIDTNTFTMPFDDFRTYIHPDDWPVYYEAAIKAVKSLDTDYTDYLQYRVIRQDGEIRHLLISIKVEFNELTGEHYRHFGTMQDITDIKYAELENRRLTEIIEATPDIVAVFSTRQSVVYLNQSARRFYGISNEADISKLQLRDLVNKEEIQELRKFIKKAVKQGIWSGEFSYEGHEGEHIPVSQVIIAHKNSRNDVEYLSTILRDISQQKEIEKNLTYKNDELDTFVYRASHDLRGPITSLFGLLNIAKYEIEDSKSKEYMVMFDAQVNRLNNIINNLMELTKIKEKDVAHDLIDFEEMVKESIASFAQLKNYDSINFRIEIEADLAYHGDKSLLATIIQNLIENGIKYANAKVDSFVRIQIKRFVPNNTLHIKVSDNGQGIPEDHKEKVFNMFFRGNESATGTGLGLYILKNAVDKLGGKIRLSSEQKLGTVFSIFLPFDI